MKPTWVSDCGRATLYLADCMDVMREMEPGSVDAVVTDPPYGIDYGHAGGFSASHGWGPWRENCKWDSERPRGKVFTEIMTVSNSQIIWGGNYFTDFLPSTMRWLVWDKGQKDFSLADFEMAWTSQAAGPARDAEAGTGRATTVTYDFSLGCSGQPRRRHFRSVVAGDGEIL